MDRLIEVKINGMHLTKDNNVAGVQYEANATVLRIEFDPGWDGYAKKVTFWSALGTNPVERTLTADLLEDLTESIRIYLCPIPGEAMTEAGKCKFVVDGWVEGKRQRSIEDTLKVKPADFIEQADQPVDPTPTQAEQLQQQVDILLGDIQKESIRAETARTGAETAQGKAEAAQAAAETAKNGAETAQGKAEAAQAAAEKAKEGVEAARDEAKTSETNAKASETAAKTSETNAKASEEAAKSAAEQAAEEAAQKTDALLADKVAAARKAEANAKASENAAKTSETNAKASETAAKTSEADAKASETAAKAAETAAKTSESSAASSASSAASSKAAAETAQGKAEAAQAAAEKARNEAEGIVGGDYISRPEAKALVDQGVSSANDYTNRAIAAIPVPDVSGQIQAHDTSQTAHRDIRQAVEDHAGDHNNPHGVTKGQVGLKNVDNTSDADKPVSTAQGEAISDAVRVHNEENSAHSDIRESITELSNRVTPVSKGGTGATTAAQALANLGGIAAGAVGNLHVWQRVQSGVTDYLTSTDRNAYPDNVTDAQDAYYTLGDVVTGEFIISTLANPTVDYKYHVSSSVVVSEDGTVHLSEDYITVNFSYGNKPTKSDFAGKFVQYYGRSSSGETDSPPDTNPPFNSTPSQIVYVPNDVNIIITTPSYIDRYQPVTGHAAIPANTTITYLGQLGGGARIEVGSYVGTGTYGSSNPNTLTFGFEPKMVVIVPETQYAAYMLALVRGVSKVTSWWYGNNSDLAFVTWADNFVSWYSTGNEGQLNLSGETYDYIAIG